MKTQGDTKHPHSVNAEFDPNVAATSVGGGVLLERTLRRLDVRRLIDKHLPERSRQAKYSTIESVYSLMAAQLLEGRGIGAAECLRRDDLASEIFGLGAKGAPSPSTMYRVLCNLSGLPTVDASEVYPAAGPRLGTMDMFGHEAKAPRTCRIVPDEAEAASPERLEALRAFLAATARRCHKSFPTSCSRLRG